MKNNHQKLQGTKIRFFSILKSLGQGAWAVVYQAIDQRDNSRVAIKAIPKIFMKQTPKLQQLVETQIKVLRQCKNENVIKFVDSFAMQKTTFIIMEYCNGGDLERYLDKKKRLTEDQATTFLKQILNGFKGLHEVNAMHRDFKVANVLLHQGICKIADLGFAKQMQKSVTKTILGTSLTMAPELLQQKPYGFEADLWSVGVVYYQLMYGKYPYQGMSDFQILKRIKNSRPDYSGMNISQKAKNFIQRCLTINTKQRISWRQVYDHPLIKQQQKIIYGLTSKLKINDNRHFYEGGVKIDQTLIYAEKNDYKKKKNQWQTIPQFKQENVQKINIEKLMKENQQKKKIEAAIEKYQKIYLNRRNNIMFIFKYVTPYVYNFSNINANHGISLFIISKKAYLEMKTLNYNIKNKINFMKFNSYFNQFTTHYKYNSLIQLTQSDLQMIMLQVSTYKEDIYSCSNEIKREFDIDKIAHPKWNQFVGQTINGYEFQLSQALDQMKNKQKIDLIKVIEALNYFNQNSENADIETFDRKIQNTDFSISESKIKEKLNSKLQWD